jgi:hypothetical protein
VEEEQWRPVTEEVVGDPETIVSVGRELHLGCVMP